MSKKVRQNIDSGLWTEAANGTIVSAFEDGEGGLHITYHNGRMPAHRTENYSNVTELETAMRKVADLRRWHTKSED